MSQSNRVRQFAGYLYVAVIFVMGFVAIGTVVGLFANMPTAASLQQQFPHLAVSADIPQHFIVASVVAGIVPVLVWLWTLDQMRRLFACYKVGAVLTDQSARFIQRIGLGFMAVALVQIVMIPVQSLILTFANPAGERSISVGLNSDMLGFLIAAGLMTVIGWAMGEAAAAAQENQAFV